MADWQTEPPYSASFALDRSGTLRSALIVWEAARDAALSRPDAPDAAFDRWGGAVDRVVAAPASSIEELTMKVQVMVTERRGGEGCLLAILADLTGIAGERMAA